MSVTKINKLDLNELAKRTRAPEGKPDEINTNLRKRLEETAYPRTGVLFERIEQLHTLMLEVVPRELGRLKRRRIAYHSLNFALSIVVLGLVYLVLEPLNSLFPKLLGDSRLPLIDSLVNLLTTATILLFALRQILREFSQKIIKDLVDELHALVHLLDMHQLAKSDAVDAGTRQIISETILICGKVAAFIHDQTDDPYVVSSVKHLETYTENVANRILKISMNGNTL